MLQGCLSRSRSRPFWLEPEPFFGPAPTPTLLYCKYFFFLDPKYDYEHKYDPTYDFEHKSEPKYEPKYDYEHNFNFCISMRLSTV